MEKYLQDEILESRRASLLPKQVKLDDIGSDDVDGDAADYILKGIRLDAAAIVQGWAETAAEDLVDDETMADRLLGMLSAAVDRDEDGELNDEEAEVFQMYVDAAWDYMLANGVTDEDCSKIFDDGDVEVANRVHDLLVEALPEGDDETTDDAYAFAMDSAAVLALDSAVFDASASPSWAKRYRGKMTVHVKHGSKKITAHRAKWRKPTAAQRMSLRKNAKRAHSATAKMRFKKSIRVSKRMGGRKVI